MKHDFFGIDYSYLRPEIDTLKLRSQPHRDEEDKRVFYYKTEYTQEENEKIAEYEKLLVTKDISFKMPPGWTKDDSLRMVSTSDFDTEKAITKTEKQIAWYESLKDFDLSEGAVKLLQNGNVFIGPRDQGGYPSLWVVFGDLKMNKDIADDFCNAMLFAAMIVKKYMMLPGYQDKFITVFDLSERNVMTLKPTLISKIMTAFQDNFNGFLYKSIIINTTATFNLLWKLLVNLIPPGTLKKFVKYDKKQKDKILEHFNKDHLSENYKGTLENPEKGTYWPPKAYHLSESKKVLDEDYIKQNQDITFFNILGVNSDKSIIFNTEFDTHSNG